VPALRERPQDIAPLAHHFLERFMEEVSYFRGKTLSQDALDLLSEHDFPGNVRELKNLIERAVYRDSTTEVTADDIGICRERRHAVVGSFEKRVADFERQLVAEALAQSEGNQAAAARTLGLSYHQLRYFKKKHRL